MCFLISIALEICTLEPCKPVSSDSRIAYLATEQTNTSCERKVACTELAVVAFVPALALKTHHLWAAAFVSHSCTACTSMSPRTHAHAVTKCTLSLGKGT